jgi:uncharacterized protein YcfL
MKENTYHKKTSVICSLAAYILVASSCSSHSEDRAAKEQIQVVVSFELSENMIPKSDLDIKKQFKKSFLDLGSNTDVSNLKISVGNLDVYDI